MHFMRDLPSKKKLAFSQSQVRHIVVPVTPQLALKRILKMVLDQPKIMKYLPDKEHMKPESMSRDFLFTIINTLD